MCSIVSYGSFLCRYVLCIIFYVNVCIFGSEMFSCTYLFVPKISYSVLTPPFGTTRYVELNIHS